MAILSSSAQQTTKQTSNDQVKEIQRTKGQSGGVFIYLQTFCGTAQGNSAARRFFNEFNFNFVTHRVTCLFLNHLFNQRLTLLRQSRQSCVGEGQMDPQARLP
jgi:hypothetical protein